MDDETQHEPRRHDAISGLFLRLGYDIHENSDVQRLASNLRYAEDRRRSDEARETNKLAWLVTGLIAILGSGLTVVGQVMFNRWFGVIPK